MASIRCRLTWSGFSTRMSYHRFELEKFTSKSYPQDSSMYVFIYKYICIYMDVNWYLTLSKNWLIQTMYHGIYHSWIVCHYDTKSPILTYIPEDVD